MQRGSDELLSQTAVMAPAADNNNQDLATKKAKLDSNSVIGGVGECKAFDMLGACLVLVSSINHSSRTC